MTELQRAKNNFEKADRRLADAYKTAFPVGTVQKYTHGQNLVECQILEHLSNYCIRVRGLWSSKEYTVHGYRFVE